jgi:UDP-glucose 4-epimerase
MGVPGHPIEHLPSRLEVHAAYSDHSKAARVFGHGPRTPLEDGVRRMAEWARKGGIRSSKPFEGVEVSRNLPPGWRRLTEAERTGA